MGEPKPLWFVIVIESAPSSRCHTDRCPSICRHLGSYAAQTADAFIEGTELAGGHVANSIATLSYLLSRILKAADKAASDGSLMSPLPAFSREDLIALLAVQRLIGESHELAAAQPQESKDLTELVSKWVSKVEGLQVGDQAFCPGGWVGLTTASTVIHIIERTAEDAFR